MLRHATFRSLRSAHLCSVRAYARATSLGIDSSVENNLQTETNRASKTLQKFWNDVSVKECDTHLTVMLDNKPLRTPLGNALSVSKDRKLLALLCK